MPAADVIAANAAAAAQDNNIEGSQVSSPSSPSSQQAAGNGVTAVAATVVLSVEQLAQSYLPAPAANLIHHGGAAVLAATDRFAKLPFVSRRLLSVQNAAATVTAAAHQAQAKVVSIRDASSAKVAEVRANTTARVASIRDASQHLIATSLASGQSLLANGTDKITHLRSDIVAIAEQSLASARIVLDQRVTPRATEAVHVTRERLAATVALVQVQLDQLRSSLATVAADPRVAPIVDRVTPVAVATRDRVTTVVASVAHHAKELSVASAAFLKAHPIRGMPAEALAVARTASATAQGRVQEWIAVAAADPRYAVVADRVRPLAASLIDLLRHTKAAAVAAAASFVPTLNNNNKTAAPTPTPAPAAATAPTEPTPAATPAPSAPATEATPAPTPSAPVVEEKNTEATPAPAPTTAATEETPAAEATPEPEEPTPAAATTTSSASTSTPQRKGAAGAGKKPKSAKKK